MGDDNTCGGPYHSPVDLSGASRLLQNLAKRITVSPHEESINKAEVDLPVDVLELQQKKGMQVSGDGRQRGSEEEGGVDDGGSGLWMEEIFGEVVEPYRFPLVIGNDEIMGCFGKVDGGIGGPVGGIEQVVEGRFEGGRKYDVDGVGKDGESVDNGRTWVQYGEIGVGDGSKVVECGGLRIPCGEADQNFANGGIEERFDAGRCGMKGIGSVGLNVEGGNIRGQCGVVGGRNKSKVVDCEGIVES
ncbi:hypothetical protein Ancab_009960 [Ancistrocladus abbreviatus]